MLRSALAVLALSSVVVLSGGPARAEVTFDELVCETKASLVAWKYVMGKTSCLVSCQRDVRKGVADPADCVPPYPPSPTAGCIASKVGRSNGSICSRCNPDGPECYPDICADTTTVLLTQLDLYFDQSFPIIYCDDSASPDGLSSLEARCADQTAKHVAKYAYGVAKCHAKCRSNEAKGLLTPGSCVPPVTDVTTQACVATLGSKTAARIDRYCAPPYGDSPECGGVPSGTWLLITEGIVSYFDASFYCEN